MKERLDKLLVQQGFCEDIEKAKRVIMAGLVIINDQKVDKAGTKVEVDSEIRIKGKKLKYVGRGGLKLEKAIKVFNLNFKEKTILDVGASTGGFTDCSLQNGAKYVYSVDVGTNQLDWKLRNNEKVKSLENIHIKNLKLDDIDNQKVDYIVMDVSFISLTKVFLYLTKFIKKEGKIMALIKPQFEVKKEDIEKGGIVRNFSKQKEAIKSVIDNAKENKLYIENLDVSPIMGGKGNVEYISLFNLKRKDEINLEKLIEKGKKIKKGVV
ncbi:MAG: TlyA family rRNA (cytidine-2'-O)-methyltransferase [Fusobacteriia bacterium 4572_132]|nr:MAG: TlyA family rRNA (cytidine-2'-O)-methyltransferase [Fusobacteriia bacterium 4572_132]